MPNIHKAADPDQIIQSVVERFPCRVLWSEGRPCLEYQQEEDVAVITEYVQTTYGAAAGCIFHSGRAFARGDLAGAGAVECMEELFLLGERDNGGV